MSNPGPCWHTRARSPCPTRPRRRDGKRHGRVLRITQFLLRLQEALTTRGLSLRGITPHGSLYPTALLTVFGSSVRHQLCQFHVLAERNKAALKAVAQARREWKTLLPATSNAVERGNRHHRKMQKTIDRGHRFNVRDVMCSW